MAKARVARRTCRPPPQGPKWLVHRVSRDAFCGGKHYARDCPNSNSKKDKEIELGVGLGLGLPLCASLVAVVFLSVARHRNQRKFDELLAKQTTLRDNYNKV